LNRGGGKKHGRRKVGKVKTYVSGVAVDNVGLLDGAVV
jgi:hypothetical protein